MGRPGRIVAGILVVAASVAWLQRGDWHSSGLHRPAAPDANVPTARDPVSVVAAEASASNRIELAKEVPAPEASGAQPRLLVRVADESGDGIQEAEVHVDCLLFDGT